MWPRVRWTSVLTDDPFEENKEIVENRCGDYHECEYKIYNAFVINLCVNLEGRLFDVVINLEKISILRTGDLKSAIDSYKAFQMR